MKNDQLIESLVTDLKPVQVLPSYFRRAIFWSCFCNIFVVAVTLATGPLRDNFFNQLLSSPQFLLEFVIGISINPIACISLFYMVIPSERSFNLKQLAAALAPFILLLLLALISTLHPALPPSMEGKRIYCSEQTLLFNCSP